MNFAIRILTVATLVVAAGRGWADEPAKKEAPAKKDAKAAAVLRKQGYAQVRYPVWIGRNREWTGRVNLYPREEIGEGMVYVPAGRLTPVLVIVSRFPPDQPAT